MFGSIEESFIAHKRVSIEKLVHNREYPWFEQLWTFAQDFQHKRERERRRGYVKDDLNPSQLFSAVAFNNILLLLYTYI